MKKQTLLISLAITFLSFQISSPHLMAEKKSYNQSNSLGRTWAEDNFRPLSKVEQEKILSMLEDLKQLLTKRLDLMQRLAERDKELIFLKDQIQQLQKDRSIKSRIEIQTRAQHLLRQTENLKVVNNNLQKALSVFKNQVNDCIVKFSSVNAADIRIMQAMIRLYKLTGDFSNLEKMPVNLTIISECLFHARTIYRNKNS